MRILSIDTSSSAGSIVVAEDEKILGEVNIDSAVTHSVRLLNGVDYLLTSLGLLPRDMDAFGVISGPGSFTGVRIGLTTTKGLAETTDRPVISITAFEAWVEQFPFQQGVIVSLRRALPNKQQYRGWSEQRRTISQRRPTYHGEHRHASAGHTSASTPLLPIARPTNLSAVGKITAAKSRPNPCS